MNSEKLTQNALRELSDGHFLDAQQLFRKCKTEFPSLMSYHNLGIFYYDNGTETENHKIRNAKKIGLRFLEHAQGFGKNFVNQNALGVIYLLSNEYVLADKALSTALEVTQTYSVLNNAAKVKYRLGEYDKSFLFMSSIFRNWQDIENLDSETIQILYINKAISALRVDKEKCLEIIEFLLYSEKTCYIDVYILSLAYYCEKYDLVVEIFERIFNKWLLSSEEMCRALHSLNILGMNDKVESYLKLYKVQNSDFVDLFSRHELKRVSSFVKEIREGNYSKIENNLELILIHSDLYIRVT